MEHIYKKGQAGHPVFVLLHGTGGDEHSLLQVANFLDADATYLAIRGDVKENGMNRYFKRYADGSYDEEDLYMRGDSLMKFIEEMSQTYGFGLEDVVLVGFSNGANIAVNLLLQDDYKINKGILMSPLYSIDTSHLTQSKEKVNVFISMGRHDPICSVEESEHVVSLFADRGANVEEFWGDSHEVTVEILEAAREWLETLK